MKSYLTLFISSLLWTSVQAQEHEQNYFAPTDPLVQAKLETWQDFKFGLLMHWGTYSQLGVVESWSICPEDEDWCIRRGPYKNDYFGYVKNYENLQTTFNPIQFQPEKWAKAAKDAGMKYMVFTTKHHDGFCMFDSQFTDYTVANEKCPYSTNPNANIALKVFDAFRKEGLWIGAYFSKPDWSNDDYWDPTFPPYDRNPNYDLTKKPKKWDRFVQFTHHQIMELMTDYGKIDLLWLDGGWVQPMTATSPRWGYKPVNQDIKMDSIVLEARTYQPGLIVVDRAVEGPNQNYLTPEQQIPAKPLPYPWESCMTMANSWSYVPNDQYKSTAKILENLCLIVSRGGNYLLNIAPNAQGEWDPVAYQRLSEIGTWMKENGTAIYGTHPLAPYEVKSEQGTWVFTQNDQKEAFAIFIPTDLEVTFVPFPMEALPEIKGNTLFGLSDGSKYKTNKAKPCKLNIPNKV
ncbi:MAG: alpha-L-fucosidase, partial [Crocinitomicaceae bacterium]